MLSTASLRSLETLFEHAALDPGAAYDERALQAPWRQYSEQWLEQAAASIAMTANNATCLLDLEGIIIDGSFCRTMLERLMQCIATAMERYDWEGIVRPTAQAGTIGPDARALGGALLPLYANFAPDHDLFLKL
jgi:predicted NBD/HSP70 family sugar kinase